MRHYRHAVNSRRKHFPQLRHLLDLLDFNRGDYDLAPAIHLIEDICQDDGPRLIAHYGLSAYLEVRPKMAARAYSFWKRAEGYGLAANYRVSGWELLRLYYEANGYCVYCGGFIELNSADLTFDHKLALANGGANAIGNIVVACRSCNSAKGVKRLVDYDVPGLGWR